MTLVKTILRSIFYEKKNGSGSSFSTKKTAAVVMTALVIVDLAIMFFLTSLHWTIAMSRLGVPEAVITALVAGEYGLPGFLFKVYKDGKAQGAA